MTGPAEMSQGELTDYCLGLASKVHGMIRKYLGRGVHISAVVGSVAAGTPTKEKFWYSRNIITLPSEKIPPIETSWKVLGYSDIDLLAIVEDSCYARAQYIKEAVNGEMQRQITRTITGGQQMVPPCVEMSVYSRTTVEDYINDTLKRREMMEKMTDDDPDLIEQLGNRIVFEFLFPITSLALSPYVHFFQGDASGTDKRRVLRDGFFDAEKSMMAGEREGSREYNNLLLIKASEETPGRLPLIVEYSRLAYGAFKRKRGLERAAEIDSREGRAFARIMDAYAIIEASLMINEEMAIEGIPPGYLDQQTRLDLASKIPTIEEVREDVRRSKVSFTPEERRTEIIRRVKDAVPGLPLQELLELDRYFRSN